MQVNNNRCPGLDLFASGAVGYPDAKLVRATVHVGEADGTCP